jgi:hypothetical protein
MGSVVTLDLSLRTLCLSRINVQGVRVGREGAAYPVEDVRDERQESISGNLDW